MPVSLEHFPRYTAFNPLVPVWCVTPDTDCAFHRFFDTSPISPSGRYLGLTQLPAEDRLPRPGDIARVLVIDLASGEAKVVAETRGWDTQLGAQVQWGADDTQLYFNDLDTESWRAYGVRLNPLSGYRHNLDGPIYMISQDGRWAASPDMLRTGRTQAGYGVIAPAEVVPVNEGAPLDDGVFLTNTETGETSLIASMKEIAARLPGGSDAEGRSGGAYYGFHVKWNPQGDRIMFVVRYLPSGKKRYDSCVTTLAADGSDIHMALSFDDWRHGGHHPNWCPDGETGMMNLFVPGMGMRLVRFPYCGGKYQVMHRGLEGSGHPSLHPNGRLVVTDDYLHGPFEFGDGSVPIRLLDVETGESRNLARIDTNPPFAGPKGELRVDPHPAWDYDFRRVAFNGFHRGTRGVYVADLAELL